jgi:hypothetical protein
MQNRASFPKLWLRRLKGTVFRLISALEYAVIQTPLLLLRDVFSRVPSSSIPVRAGTTMPSLSPVGSAGKGWLFTQDRAL